MQNLPWEDFTPKTQTKGCPEKIAAQKQAWAENVAAHKSASEPQGWSGKIPAHKGASPAGTADGPSPKWKAAPSRITPGKVECFFDPFGYDDQLTRTPEEDSPEPERPEPEQAPRDASETT